MNIKKISIITVIVLSLLSGIIKLNYSSIAWLVYPEQYAKDTLDYPELNVSVIAKDDKSYLYIESINCFSSRLTFNNEVIFDEESLSKIIPNYKLNSYSTYKPSTTTKYDNNKNLILIKNTNLINQRFVCFKKINWDMESYRGAKETEVKYENGKITVTKI